MNWITTSSFSVIINRTPKDMITPQRGLRQGCPLSLYLFIICAKTFSNLLRLTEKKIKKKIQGLRFRQHISISHILFTDDNLIFSKASLKDCQHLKDIFDCYAHASGQFFNLVSLVCFSVAMFMKISFSNQKNFILTWYLNTRNIWGCP